MGKSITLKSVHVRFGARTFFFDVNQSVNNKKYLKITESKFIEEGKLRQYNSLILFPDQLESFQKNLGEAVAFLK